MDWETLYCSNRHCRYYGVPFRQALLVKNGSSHGHPQAWCRACGRRIAVTYGTAYFDRERDFVALRRKPRPAAENESRRAEAEARSKTNLPRPSAAAELRVRHPGARRPALRSGQWPDRFRWWTHSRGRAPETLPWSG
jgi:hypothetical protein